jgi:hypothetical protein
MNEHMRIQIYNIQINNELAQEPKMNKPMTAHIQSS